MALMFGRQITPSIKIIVDILMLMYFGSQLTFAKKDIPFCQKQLKEIKDDVKDWNERCMVDSYRERNTPQCNKKKKYNQASIRNHTNQCFYKGKYIPRANAVKPRVTNSAPR